MSDQGMEMQFADPDWQPPQGQQSRPPRKQRLSMPVEDKNFSDPDLQSDQPDSPNAHDRDKAGDYAEYSRGYQGASTNDHSQETAQKPQKQARRRRSSLFWLVAAIILIALIANPIGEDFFILFWRVLLIIVAVGVVLALFFAISRSRRSTSSSETHTFSVEAQPKINIRDDVGSIRVHAGGDESQVVMQATRRSRVLLGGEIDVKYDQNTAKNSITVKASSGWTFIGSKSVDFDVTVPRNADLELKNDAGSISVDGIAGQVSCSTDAGSVKVTDTWLCGNSKLKTDAGSITFSGALDSRGSYQMSSDAGSINVTLPPGASFRLDAKTDVGSINSDFPLNMQRDFPGGKARCDVGPPPYPVLKLRTDVGSINIRQWGE
jgi:hypothetical protein